MNETMRLDYHIILNAVEPGARVLDLGCGSGELLCLLAREKQVQAQGIELDDAAVLKCVQSGVSVLQGDLDRGLSDYPDLSFDHVILNQCLNEVQNFNYVLSEALRIGRKVIVGFPNFAHISRRLSLLFHGSTPVIDSPARQWHDTQNLRTPSIRDFKTYCRNEGIYILKAWYLAGQRRLHILPNLFATDALFVVAKQ